MNIQDEIEAAYIAHVHQFSHEPEILIMHPNTSRDLSAEKLPDGSDITNMRTTKGWVMKVNRYRGWRVIRSTDLKENEIILK